MASAMLLWGVDTVLAVWASIIFLLHGSQQVAFIGLTLAALFSIAFTYEFARLKGIRWVRSQTKEQLVAYARAYMFQHRKANQATGYQLQGSSQDGDYQGKLGTGDVDVNVSSKTGDVVDFTLKSFHADMQSSARLMAKAICRFTGIHAFC